MNGYTLNCASGQTALQKGDVICVENRQEDRIKRGIEGVIISIRRKQEYLRWSSAGEDNLYIVLDGDCDDMSGIAMLMAGVVGLQVESIADYQGENQRGQYRVV